MKPAARMRLPHQTVIRPAKTKGNPHIGPQLQGKPSIRGSRHPSAKLDELTVQWIWRLKTECPKWGPKRIKRSLEGLKLTATESQIHNVLQRKAWAWMAPEV